MSNPIKLLLLLVSLLLFIRCQRETDLPDMLDVHAYVEEYANKDSLTNYIQHDKFNLENTIHSKIYMINNHKDSLVYVIVFEGDLNLFYYNRELRGMYRKKEAVL